MIGLKRIVAWLLVLALMAQTTVAVAAYDDWDEWECTHDSAEYVNGEDVTCEYDGYTGDLFCWQCG